MKMSWSSIDVPVGIPGIRLAWLSSASSLTNTGAAAHTDKSREVMLSTSFASSNEVLFNVLKYSFNDFDSMTLGESHGTTICAMATRGKPLGVNHDTS